MTGWLKSIILSMDRSHRELSQTTIGSIQQPLQADILMLGMLLPVPVVLLLLLGEGGNVLLLLWKYILFGRLYCVLLFVGWVLLGIIVVHYQ
jgi:hypothetical protein